MYKIIWDTKSLRDLEALDNKIAIQIVKKVDSYLIQNPKNLGKVLSANYKGLYRYRDYRIVYEILDQEKTIRITKVGHRSKIYEE